MNYYFGGASNEILQTLEAELNFTTSIFKRKDGYWGSVQTAENVTHFGRGMIGDLFHGKVDILAVQLVVNVERSKHFDFLTPMASDFGSIFIAKDAIREEIDYGLTFAGPFKRDMWIAVLTSFLIILISQLFIMYKHHCLKLSDTFITIWNSCTSFLGKL